MNSPAENQPGASVPPTSTADVGVLLVHGIGNHREGATLTAFGQPLLDWLQQWLQGKGGDKARGGVTVTEAQFNGDDAPAYALAEVTAPGRVPNGPAKTERWLFCEGWWGETVQPPPSLPLLRWMWTRGPLLIYWHFYVRQTAQTEKPGNFFDVWFSLTAFLLASLCQLIVGVAIVLWLIPIGPWRRLVVDAVRSLTLTLGDSYVLEQDIQRAALIERIRRAHKWLEERSARTVIIAHSQGGALAHELLRQGKTEKLRMFISVGSGLEKLHFLREVAARRTGMLAASLPFPATALGVVLVVSATRTSGEHWETVLGISCFFLGFVSCAVLLGRLGNYKRRLEERINDLPLLQLGPRHWIDLFASKDIVPMNRGSRLNGQPFVRREEVGNERSYLHDHTAYFANPNDALPRIWKGLARVSRLRLFSFGERRRLRRWAFVHQGYCHLLSWSRLALALAFLLSGIVLWSSLLGFGRSVLAAAAGTPMEDWLKPLRAVAGGLAWFVQHLFSAKTVTADVLANALFGALILFGAMALWWVIFHAFWRARCAVRWRKARHGQDILRSRSERAWTLFYGAIFLAFGCLPLIVSIILARSPGALTLHTLGMACARAVAGAALLAAFLYAAVAPWTAAALWSDREQPRYLRYTAPVLLVLFVYFNLRLARWLWPSPVPPSVQTALLISAAVTMTVAWLVYAVWKFRRRTRP